MAKKQKMILFRIIFHSEKVFNRQSWLIMRAAERLHCKKRIAIFQFPAGNNLISVESLISDIPLGTGNSLTLFFSETGPWQTFDLENRGRRSKFLSDVICLPFYLLFILCVRCACVRVANVSCRSKTMAWGMACRLLQNESLPSSPFNFITCIVTFKSSYINKG